MKNHVLLILSFLISSMVASQNFKNITETSDGFIGIGTKNPDALLTVKGAIHTQEVMVDLDGAVAPDYVFEKYYLGFSTLKNEYQFLSLSEIENYIKENHHLPNIPSAEELDKNGLSLKEMNLILLEKIEELTLHTIEQQKQINQLFKLFETQENE